MGSTEGTVAKQGYHLTGDVGRRGEGNPLLLSALHVRMVQIDGWRFGFSASAVPLDLASLPCAGQSVWRRGPGQYPPCIA